MRAGFVKTPAIDILTGWKRVVFSAECDDDGNCPVCETDFADCGCPGPTQEDEFEYIEVKGALWPQFAVGQLRLWCW